jgi:3-isopropylmalate/(R)-2-methylmalate dehydratase small subunit
MTDPVNEPLDFVRSPLWVLREENVDTDQILPARFMTSVTRWDLGGGLFRDWRDADEMFRRRFDKRQDQGSCILVAGKNFGVGSSREHAVWALMDFGIRVVISPAFADIFAGNAVRNGLLTIVVPTNVHDVLLDSDGEMAEVDLSTEMLKIIDTGLSFKFDTDAFARWCLLEGLDALTVLKRHQTMIARHAAKDTIPRPNTQALAFRFS